MELTRIFYLHEIGSKRNQEDYLWPVPPTATPDDRIFIVCDGVGGSGYGEVASKIVAETVGTGLLKTPAGEIGPERIDALLEAARLKMVAYAAEHGMAPDMATTFCMLYLTGDKAFISWLGDSRVYHLGHHEVLYRTEDHSLVNSLVRTGQISAEEARIHPQKNLLLQAVRAGEAHPHADSHWIADIRDGDHFLLCTDGLLENVTEADFFHLIAQEANGTMDLAAGFRQLCLDRTKDNYSLYMIQVRTTDASAARTRSSATRRRTRMIMGLSFLVVLVCAAAGIFFIMGNRKPQPRLEIMVPVPDKPDSTADDDDSAKTAKDSTTARSADSAGMRLDSSAVRRDSTKVRRDSTKIRRDSSKVRHDSSKVRHDSTIRK